MPSRRPGIHIAELLRADPVERRLYQLAFTATAPVLHIADGAEPSLEVLATAVDDAGRRLPVIACARNPVEPEPSGTIVRLGGSPAAEVQALTMRFDAVVIHRGSGDAIGAELAALEGRLMAGAVVLVLGRSDDDALEPPAHLEVREHQETVMLLAEPEGERQRRSRGGELESRRRRRRELDAAREEAESARRAAERSLRDLETLGRRLSATEAAEAGLMDALARAREQLHAPVAGEIPPSSSRPAVTGSPVTVIAAIHDGYEGLEGWLAGVLAVTPAPHELLLIDDGSSDPRVRALLEELRDRSPRVIVLERPQRSDPGALTLGCNWARGDVVLLERGTELPAGWLDGLRSVAHSRRDIATVAPLSDRELPGADAAAIAPLVARLSERLRPRAAAGRRRCLYIRRDALDRLGGYDDAFRQRAEAAALVNLVDDATFVSHSPPAKRRRGAGDDGLARLRAGVSAATKGSDAERPTILLILHAGAGGTPQTNRDLTRSLSAGFRCLTLACDLDHWLLRETTSGGEVELERFAFAREWAVAEPLDRERSDALRAICERERVALVHVRSLIATGPELVDVVKALALPLICSLHDFWTVCPTIQLLDENERFCSGHCTPGPGPCPTSKRWVSGLPPLKHAYVHEWKERMARQLARADAFVTTSEAARDVLVDHFGFMDDGRMRVIEHGRDTRAFRPVSVPPAERPRVVAFGALGIAKGATLLQALLELDQREGPAFEFHFLGPLHGTFTPEALGGVVHGDYERDELPDRLAAIAPSFALVTSIWTETYCHTLTEAWMADLPVFASDIGTLRERIARGGGGWLLDHTEPAAFYAGMRRVREQIGEWHLRRAEIARMPARTVDDMAADYRSLYRELLGSPVTLR